MKIKHAINDIQSMSHDGGKILKSLQNNYLPIIDIVVREAIQNSLDAALESEEKAIIEFKIDKFKSEKFAPFLEEIDHILMTKYPGDRDFISISDKNTCGLTGDYASTDYNVLNNSNFHKLVFSIGKNQTKDGAGGSWGYGKTSYFRLGVGIVIYYTRIRLESNYEERLIASIIEDPSKDDRLLYNNERGIAWWGEYASDNERIFPITDSNKISEILSIFGLTNYSGEETGTTIIIPYLNELDKEVIDIDALKYPWEFSYEDAISMAVQRWYFPRIYNVHYREKFGRSYLECRVNGNLIHPENVFEPIFKIYQELYTSALLGEALESNIKVEPINLGRNALKNRNEEVGYVAFREVSFEELKMTPPDNKLHGLAYLGIKDKISLNHNMPKVVAYCRLPGMIVEYSVNGPWASGDIPVEENHILLGIFVPNSHAQLISNYQKAGHSTLEAYLRDIETSDHASWEDNVDYTIVTRIRNRTNQAITNVFLENNVLESSTATSILSRKFGSILLPPKNFGKSSSRKGGESGDQAPSRQSKNVRTRGADVSLIRSIPVDDKTVEVTFKVFVKPNSTNYLFIQVLTQDQRMDLNAWVKAMDTIPFPFWISNVKILSVNNNEISYDQYFNNIELRINEDNNTLVEIISSLDNVGEIEGSFILNMHSNLYIPNLAIRTL